MNKTTKQNNISEQFNWLPWLSLSSASNTAERCISHKKISWNIDLILLYETIGQLQLVDIFQFILKAGIKDPKSAEFKSLEAVYENWNMCLFGYQTLLLTIKSTQDTHHQLDQDNKINNQRLG